MTQAPYPVAPAPSRKAGPGLGVSLVVIGVGIVIGIVSVVTIALPLSGVLTSTQYTVPGTLHLHLNDHQYVVYQRTGTNGSFGGFDRDPTAVRISPSAVTVVAPDGTRVPVYSEASEDEITRGTVVYTASLEFDAPVSGDYELRFTNAIPTRVVITRPVRDTVESVLVWFGVGALGGLIIVIGIVMLIVGATRRGRARRAMYAGWGGAPGGWYGGPQQQWGTPGVTAPYPQQYPSQYPPGSYTPPGYAPPGYAPPAYPPPPAAYPPPPPPQSSPPPEPAAGYPPPADAADSPPTDPPPDPPGPER